MYNMKAKEVLKMKVMYPGSFDPITIGHLDLIERSSKLFDEVVVAIMKNDQKKGTFTMEERLQLAQEAVAHLPNVEVKVGSGLTIDFARQEGCSTLVRGIRAVMDYETELQQATANRTLASDIETIFLVASPKYSYISSSLARELAHYEADLSLFVPKNVEEALNKKYQK